MPLIAEDPPTALPRRQSYACWNISGLASIAYTDRFAPQIGFLFMIDQPDKTRSKDFVSTLANGLAAIRAFSQSETAMTFSDVARQTGLTRAAARRILLTLQSLGYVEAVGKSFRLQPSVLDLGYSYLSSLGWLGLAQQEMSNLALQVRLPCSAAVLHGEDIIYVLRITPEMDPRITLSISVGQRFPAYVTAFGHVLLGALPEAKLDDYFSRAKFEKLTPQTIVDPKKLRKRCVDAKTQGWAFVEQEHAARVCSLAAPIIGTSEITIAALGVGWLVGREKPAAVRDRVLPNLLSASTRLNQKSWTFRADLKQARRAWCRELLVGRSGYFGKKLVSTIFETSIFLSVNPTLSICSCIFSKSAIEGLASRIGARFFILR